MTTLPHLTREQLALASSRDGLLGGLDQYREKAAAVLRGLQAGVQQCYPLGGMIIGVDHQRHGRLEVRVDMPRATLIELVKASIADTERKIRQLGVEPEPLP